MAIFTGRRLYTNNVQGTTTDNPLTDSATTMNSAGLANLAAVSGNHAVIVLDPLRAAGAPELVIVTAHTGSATSATISRGAYSTTPRQHAAGTLWVHPVTKDDLIQVLTANPTDLFEGQLWFRSDTDIFMAHNGSAAVEALPIGAWQTYTPTLTQSGTVTHTVDAARYTRHGRLIHAVIALTVTGSGSASNAVTVSLPVTAQGNIRVAGSGYIFDTSANLHYSGPARLRTTTTADILAGTAPAANVLGISEFSAGLASGDLVHMTLAYEAAS